MDSLICENFCLVEHLDESLFCIPCFLSNLILKLKLRPLLDWGQLTAFSFFFLKLKKDLFFFFFSRSLMDPVSEQLSSTSDNWVTKLWLDTFSVCALRAVSLALECRPCELTEAPISDRFGLEFDMDTEMLTVSPLLVVSILSKLLSVMSTPGSLFDSFILTVVTDTGHCTDATAGGHLTLAGMLLHQAVAVPMRSVETTAPTSGLVTLLTGLFAALPADVA